MIFDQVNIFLIFIANGLIIGILFDLFRIYRKSFKTPDIITYIQDILFWILTGLILLYSIFTFNNGEIRFYIFMAVFMGCLIYMLLFSKYFININVKIVLRIKQILFVIRKIIIVVMKFFINIPRNLIKSNKNKKI